MVREVASHEEFTELVDFAQYTEREVVEESPGSYIPVKTLQLVALADDNKIGSTKGDERRVVAVLKHMGHKVRYDEGKWWCWTQSEGWLRDDNDTNIKTAVKAEVKTAVEAGVEVEAEVGGTELCRWRGSWPLAVGGQVN